MCPCGSGKRYKKCCLKSGRFGGSQRDHFFQGTQVGSVVVRRCGETLLQCRALLRSRRSRVNPGTLHIMILLCRGRIDDNPVGGSR
ncbi:MAG: SEC-C metal-binding domain-containing protein [Pseudomonadota bacterium]